MHHAPACCPRSIPCTLHSVHRSFKSRLLRIGGVAIVLRKNKGGVRPRVGPHEPRQAQEHRGAGDEEGQAGRPALRLGVEEDLRCEQLANDASKRPQGVQQSEDHTHGARIRSQACDDVRRGVDHAVAKRRKDEAAPEGRVRKSRARPGKSAQAEPQPNHQDPTTVHGERPATRGEDPVEPAAQSHGAGEDACAQGSDVHRVAEVSHEEGLHDGVGDGATGRQREPQQQEVEQEAV
mmetsp:Transcript_111489/g.296304  ORF Transcript_111489/g.296304 Transcript_111489/m.296304 type:complete len:236 (-) Transcript_111489:666-1373(-)